MKPSREHYDLLLRDVKFVLDTKSLGVKFAPSFWTKKPWIFKTFVDSDWAGNKDTRKSVTGWCLFIKHCLIGLGSKGQNVVTC